MQNISNEENFKWRSADIMCLINLFAENYTMIDRQQKKVFWSDIADELSTLRGKKVTGEQCDGKWKGLKAMYKKVQEHNNTSGNSSKTWEYFDLMDDLLNRRPEISPPATYSSDCFSSENFKWSPGDIRCLINLFAENYTMIDRQQKKIFWSDIADELSTLRGKKVTGEQCDGKWKGLKAMYKKVRDHNNTSGNSSKTWEYFDLMNDLLNRRPEMNPPATCSSDSRDIRVNYQTNSLGASCNTDYDFADCVKEDSTISTPPLKKRKLIDEDKNRRHKEKMEMQKRFLDLFEKLIDKL